MSITNTSKSEMGWTLGLNPGAIETQEAEGQAELVRSSQLPTKGLKSVIAAHPDIVLERPSPGDDLFSDVTLPDGWQVRATDRSMWSELVDASGAVVAEIFYKAAYYDRVADIQLSRKVQEQDD